MGWEDRNGRRYYYRKHRQVDGTISSEYMGYGAIGDLFFFQDGKERHERTMARLALQEIQSANRRIEQVIEEYRRQVRKVGSDTLCACGFHQHKGQWRLKRREARTMANEVVKATKEEITEYFALRKAAEGKKSGPVLERLREYVQMH